MPKLTIYTIEIDPSALGLMVTADMTLPLMVEGLSIRVQLSPEARDELRELKGLPPWKDEDEEDEGEKTQRTQREPEGGL